MDIRNRQQRNKYQQQQRPYSKTVNNAKSTDDPT